MPMSPVGSLVMLPDHPVPEIRNQLLGSSALFCVFLPFVLPPFQCLFPPLLPPVIVSQLPLGDDWMPRYALHSRTSSRWWPSHPRRLLSAPLQGVRFGELHSSRRPTGWVQGWTPVEPLPSSCTSSLPWELSDDPQGSCRSLFSGMGRFRRF